MSDKYKWIVKAATEGLTWITSSSPSPSSYAAARFPFFRRSSVVQSFFFYADPFSTFSGHARAHVLATAVAHVVRRDALQRSACGSAASRRTTVAASASATATAAPSLTSASDVHQRKRRRLAPVPSPCAEVVRRQERGKAMYCVSTGDILPRSGSKPGAHTPLPRTSLLLDQTG